MLLQSHTHRLLFRLGQFFIALTLVVGVCAPAASRAQADSSTAASVPVQVVDLFKGAISSSPSEMTAIGSTIFFRAAGDNVGYELWKMDPPYTEAYQATDIGEATASSFPEKLTVLGQTLFFTADDGKTGREIWRLDPPYTQATQVADVNPGADSSNPHDLVVIGDGLFFAANDGSSGDELWMTTPPYNSATRVADIWPGGGSSSPSYLVHIGWDLFFVANDSAAHEIWKSEPPYTQTSTYRITDIYPSGDADPQSLTVVGNILFYSAIGNDGQYGHELWMTEAPYNTLTTRPVNTFTNRYVNPSPADLYAIGDTLFFSANIGLIGRELWKVVPPYRTTDMTRVRDVNPGFFQGSNPRDLASIGTYLFYIADDPTNGTNIWVSHPPYDDDHTERTETSNPTMSDPKDLTPVGKIMYFTAVHPTYGRQVWMSEFNYDTATMTGDRNAGIRTTNPLYLTNVGDALFFQATTAKAGAELWTIGGLYGIPATGFSPNRVTHLDAQPDDKRYASTELSLEIPSQGITTSIVGVPAQNSQWDLSWLGSNTGYLEGTAYPTRAGNTVLTGHATLSTGQAGPFAGLASLKWGDEVVLHVNGQKYVYQVRTNDIVQPNDRSVFNHEDQPWVTLITCHDYDPDTNTYRERIVVRAVLVRVE
jgi:LPXTG-site transpeptidase (sortase) family protein